MPKRANDISRAGAVEGVRWYFSDERPKGPPPKPFWLTYAGDDVVTVKGVGLFQNGTTAEVGPATAARFRDQPGWLVRERERPREEEDEAPEAAAQPGQTPPPSTGAPGAVPQAQTPEPQPPEPQEDGRADRRSDAT